MLIYIFAEHYPNPYKPQFDTEFAYLLRQGHEIRIFVAGQFVTTVHPRVRSYGLDQKTSRFPTTLRTLPHFAGPILARAIRSPMRSLRRALAVRDAGDSSKQNLMRVARMMTLPEREPDLCYIHNIATAENIDFLRRLYPASRLVMYFHGGEVGGVKRVARDVHLFRSMDITLTNSGFSRQQAIHRGCPADRVVVVPVGFDLADYPAAGPRRYRADGLLRLISIGRLSEEKGLLFSLAALAELVAAGQTDVRYTIIGLGLQEEALRTFVTENGLDPFVEFVGEQDKAGVVSHLGRSDVLVLPSVVTDTWAETQAAVVQEAMFMRALVIGTRTGGVPESTAEVLRPFSVEPGSASSIAAMIRSISSLREEEMARLGEAAREYAIGRFSIESTGAELLGYAMGDTGADASTDAARARGDLRLPA